ncbi:probable dimethyladenosine transferase [Methanocella paludicola SANAE]|uniref:Probable ribosomal RNA small subunit methyltransferase A n=1 Tax=Methanocella paludicola (strain DSM 17711 / JCM 13418 / NBRC 101707 / SANAE) TaxID=304371 RepID=D1YWH6_METPS|nr:16S rRNA (adenine(1518)-N(6)/adenine(1519)-N(6))-dimethyltransferase RsmA [Methanocella paludicola]BAI60798.1 probable dimethyladenosine transferase [Methanocella paludicola SANAE]
MPAFTALTAFIAPDKRKDQHFLIDLNILKKIVAIADIHKDEDVLEIGTGPGNLTELLAQKARHVYTIEMDPALVALLEEKFKGSNVTIIKGNALKVEFPRFDKVVANLPYSISSDVTFKLLKNNFKLGILMYQREFAQRMIARVGEPDYSRLSVDVQHFADVEILMKVPPQAFSPPPEVESAVVRVTPRPAAYSVKDRALFMALVTAAFTQRRKRLRNALVNGAHIMGIHGMKALVSRLPPDLMDKRAEEVSPEEYAALADRLYELTAHERSGLSK